ncbi:MAG: TOBE domain-containing protein, partial [Cyanobacteria bacterium J06642_11]
IDQVATPAELFKAPASRFVARFIGDNNIFTGNVLDATPQADGQDLIKLEVEGIGSLYATGNGTQPGTEAACCVRPDLLTLEPGEVAADGQGLLNAITARITQVELTGFVTRVALLATATGQPLLHTLRTVDAQSLALQEGQTVLLKWSANDCVFLAH